jgi:hypothetical protein
MRAVGLGSAITRFFCSRSNAGLRLSELTPSHARRNHIKARIGIARTADVHRSRRSRLPRGRLVGLLALGRTAPCVLERLYTEVAEVLRMPEVKEYGGMGSLNLA